MRFELERGGFGAKVYETEARLYDFISRNECGCIDWANDTEDTKKAVNLLSRLFDFMCSNEKEARSRTAHFFEISTYINQCLDRSEEKQQQKNFQIAIQVTDKIKEKGLLTGIADEVTDIVYTLVPIRNDRERTEAYLRSTLTSGDGRSLHNEELRDAILSGICDDCKFTFGYAYYFLGSWRNRTSGGEAIDDCNKYANEESVNYSLWCERQMAEIEQADNLHRLELARQARRSPIHINMPTEHKLRSAFDKYLNLIISDYSTPYSQPQQRSALCQKQDTKEKKQTHRPKDNEKKPKGRPSKPFNSVLVGNENKINTTLITLHNLMNGKNGSQAVLYIKAAIIMGVMQRPTYTQFKKEFGEIASKAIYNKYVGGDLFSNDEIEGAQRALTATTQPL